MKNKTILSSIFSALLLISCIGKNSNKEKELTIITEEYILQTTLGETYKASEKFAEEFNDIESETRRKLFEIVAKRIDSNRMKDSLQSRKAAPMGTYESTQLAVELTYGFPLITQTFNEIVDKSDTSNTIVIDWRKWYGVFDLNDYCEIVLKPNLNNSAIKTHHNKL